MKICKKCGEEKENIEFYKNKNSCKSCVKSHIKEWRSKNKDKVKKYNKKWNESNSEYYAEYRESNEKIKEYNKKWRNSNKDKFNKYNKEYRDLNKERYKNYRNINKEYSSIYGKEYRKNHKERKNELERKRKINNPLYKLSHNIRSSLRFYINKGGFKKTTKTQEILGCSFLEFKLYIESKFESWMNWENKGLYNGEFNYGWDIDHIIPISHASNLEELLKLNHYTNLQPLCSKINRDIKRDLLDWTM